MDKITLVEAFNEHCSLWRYRCPSEYIEDLAHEGSRYSPEFDVGGIQWRLHLQHRLAAQSNEVFLAVHLQCCSQKGAYGHFKISINNRDVSQVKTKTFHCHFKKVGSAWGLHHFVPLETLLAERNGFLESADAKQRSGSAGGVGGRFVTIDIILNVLEPGADGTYSLGQLPQPTQPKPIRFEQSSARGSGSLMRAGSSLPPPPPPNGYGAREQSATNGNVYQQDPLTIAHVKATLVYPFEHLESLCDMWFDVQGIRINAHRCVVACRMGPLLPPQILPLQPNSTVTIQAPMDVFAAFLRYVYTEEYPEQGVLAAESLLDLYLLAAQCEFWDLCGVCLRLVRPLLTTDNILPLVLSRYNPNDEILTAMYLRVLIEHYDYLITDRLFEEIPGHLFRRVSLVLRDKEKLPPITIPPSKCTLGKQLATLAESGEYSDVELETQCGVLKAHKYILASRSVLYSQALHPKSVGATLPSFTHSDYNFSQRCWTKFLGMMYRRHIDTPKDLSPEDIAIVIKMTAFLTMDGQLRREAESVVNGGNALRVLIAAVKHNVSELKERSLSFVATNFPAMVRQDPNAWELISDLPQQSVVTLFRMVTESAMQ